MTHIIAMFTFHLGWPQIIYLLLVAIGLIKNIVSHGKSKSEEQYNAFVYLLSLAVAFALLSWGGFFTP